MEERLLLVDVAIILSSAFPLLFLGRWLRVPVVISYLVTGIVIGPHALAWIRDAHRVEAIAEIGVALILFFIGLHVPLAKLRTFGRTTFISGTLQMALTVAAGLAVSLPFGAEPRSAVFYSLMVALGSTAVVLPILTARDEMGAPFARRFLGVSLFQDFAVIPLMLLVPAFAVGGAPSLRSVLPRVLVAIVGVVVLILVARVVVPRVFSHIARLGSRETFTAATIVLILGTIAIAGRLGISAALGAFAAGVVIGDTDFIHEIGGVLRPFRDFLSALFFASIGMLLEPRFIYEHIFLVLGIVVMVVGLKIAAAYPAFRAGGSLPRTSMRAAFAVAPIGEFSFLLAQEGKRQGVLSGDDQQLLIAVAVLTLAGTPVLLSAGSALAAKLRGGREPDEETHDRRRKNHIIIVGYGLNGQNVARVLNATNVPHVILEEDPGRAEVARADGGDVIVADAADPDALETVAVGEALVAVIAISDPDGTRRIVRACRAQSETLHILVRTRYVSEVERLRALGANEVIPEEFETSIEIVTRLMRVLGVPGNLVAAQLRLLRDEGYRMLRDPALRTAEGRRLSAVLAAGTAQTYLVLPDTAAEGRTLEELRIADDHLAVPAILRDGVPMPSPAETERLRSGDMLFLVGAHEDLVRVTDRLDQTLTAPESLPG